MTGSNGLHCVPASADGDTVDHGHLVQFYESDSFLSETVGEYIVEGLDAGETTIVVATKEHRQAIDEVVGDGELDLQELRNEGRYILLDAAEVLSRFMVDGEPEPALFSAAVGSVIARAAEAGRGVRIFGEMVALLWDDGNVQGAIRLEELWNELAEAHPFSLLCAYRIQDLGTDTEAFHEVCAQHSRVIPAESYTGLSDPTERLLAITELQMRARIGEGRIEEARRQALELNNTVVQGLAAAKMALELKEYEMLETSVARTLERTTELVSELLTGGSKDATIGPGDLRNKPRSA